ncbi:hypothetical protein ACFLWA_09155 [Chloroflexota bacterium]
MISDTEYTDPSAPAREQVPDEPRDTATRDVSPARKPKPPEEKLRASHKIGVDANRPVHPKTGKIQAQVADPGIVASTGAGWVRLNFLLRPWDHPHDETLYQGRTWEETYRRLVSGFRDNGLQVYGLIGCEAMPQIPKNQFRSPPPDDKATDGWIDAYAEQSTTIVKMFKDEIRIFESFNEPDDWHGQNQNWIHAGWFAVMLQRVYDAVHSDPTLEHIRLVSGPLQGLQANRNGPVHYLRATYRAGRKLFGWGQEGVPFPFDGVGYHIYVKPGYTQLRNQQARAIRQTYRRYLKAMHQLIREEEGKDKPLFVSELGWTSNVDYKVVQRREDFQAHSLHEGLRMVFDDPLVELGFCFCTQDFRIETRDEFYGLYRMGDLKPWNRKPAFYTFKAFCERELDARPEAEGAAELGEEEADMEELAVLMDHEGETTNQDMIAAFYYAAADLRLQNRWALLAKAGLNLRELAANRRGPYLGPRIEQLPTLTRREQDAILARLSADSSAGDDQGLTLTQTPPVARQATGTGETLDAGLSLDLTVALQQEVAQELTQLRGLLEQFLAQLHASDVTDASPG